MPRFRMARPTRWCGTAELYAAAGATAYGCHVSPAGALLEAPRTFAHGISSSLAPSAVTWNGRQYVAAFDQPVYRLDVDGRSLSTEYLGRFSSVALASRGGRTLGVGSRDPNWQGPFSDPFVVVSFADSHDCCFESAYDTAAHVSFGTVAAGPRLAVSVLPDPTGTRWIVRDFDSRREIARVPAAAHPPHVATTSTAFFLAGAGALTSFSDMGIRRAIAIPGALGEIAVAEAPDGAALVFYASAGDATRAPGLVVERIDAVTPRRPAVRH
jgi:hypothetical protein